jgi:transposase InsO family protein
MNAKRRLQWRKIHQGENLKRHPTQVHAVEPSHRAAASFEFKLKAHRAKICWQSHNAAHEMDSYHCDQPLLTCFIPRSKHVAKVCRLWNNDQSTNWQLHGLPWFARCLGPNPFGSRVLTMLPVQTVNDVSSLSPRALLLGHGVEPRTKGQWAASIKINLYKSIG